MHLRLIGISLIAFSAIPSSAYAASINVSAGCGFRFFKSLNVAEAEYCEGLVGPALGGSLNTFEQVKFVDTITAYRLAEAGYAVTVADYGHFGALVGTYATHPQSSWGTGVEATASVGLQYTDSITISSNTLAHGTVVPIDLSYRITGDYGANRGDSGGYYTQNAEAILDGFVTLDWLQPGATPPSHSTFHVDTGSLLGDGETGSFNTYYSQTIYLTVGSTYLLNAAITMQAWSSLVAYQSCPDIGCIAGSYVDSSHSFFTYLTPQTDNFQITSESGHDYAISAVPEPASYLLVVAGLLPLRYVQRRMAKSSIVPSST